MRPIITDGVTASSAHMSRPFGSDCSCSILKFCCTRVALVSMIGDTPLTVTVSCNVASARSALTCAVKPSAIAMPSRFSVVNPASSKLTA